jgi:hypothetical protein
MNRRATYDQGGDRLFDCFHFDQRHFAIFFEEFESFDRAEL